MLERDRLSLKRYREELAAEEAKEREERERPIREAEERLKATHRELAKVLRARLIGEVKDPEMYIDPSVSTVRLTQVQANDFNVREIETYRQAHPETYWSSELVEALGKYFESNKIRIVTASMLEKLIDRMRDLALLPERPEPETEPEPQQPVEQQAVEQPTPETFTGYDPYTGLERVYTRKEVDRMSSDSYRRAFRVYRAHLTPPARNW